MVLKTQVSRLMGRTLLSGLMGTAYGLQARLSGAVLILVLIMALFAQPGFAARLGIMKTMTASAVSGEDLSDERRETARNMTERLYWGRQVASSNPSLTGREIHEIGRAVLKYSTEYGLPPNLIVAVIKVESSGRVSAVSPKGAQGLMQVMPFWKRELGIEGTLFVIDNNIRAGACILSGYIKRYGYREGIARYYRGSMNVDGQPYYEKVQRAMQA